MRASCLISNKDGQTQLWAAPSGILFLSAFLKVFCFLGQDVFRRQNWWSSWTYFTEAQWITLSPWWFLREWSVWRADEHHSKDQNNESALKSKMRKWPGPDLGPRLMLEEEAEKGPFVWQLTVRDLVMKRHSESAKKALILKTWTFEPN